MTQSDLDEFLNKPWDTPWAQFCRLQDYLMGGPDPFPKKENTTEGEEQ